MLESECLFMKTPSNRFPINPLNDSTADDVEISTLPASTLLHHKYTMCYIVEYAHTWIFNNIKS